MPTYEENIALSKRGGGMAGIPDMSAYLGRPLTIGEERTLMHALEERMGIETEAKRLQTERDKILLEGEKSKQALIARAIESMTPGWERGGERVDVGGFSRGGAPMQQVAVGPGQPGREITPATGPGVQYRQPGAEQQRMGQELIRRQMGLTPEDPLAKFDRELQKMEEHAILQSQREEARDVRAEKRLGVREEATGKRTESRIAAEALKAETAQGAAEAKALKLKFEDVLTGTYKDYTKRKNVIESDLTKTSEYRDAALEDLKDSYNAAIGIVVKRAAKYGIEMDVEEFGLPKDPSILTRRQIDWYKAMSRKKQKAFAKAYEDKFGKPLEIKVE